MGHEASFTPFELEEWQSRYETTVKYNLADSGCHPVRLSELVSDPAAVEKLLSLDLHYPPVGGTDALRELCASWHGAKPENVLVTVGAAEANSIAVASLLQPGDHMVVMEPNYRQVRGCAVNMGASVSAFPLDPARGWRPDLDALAAAVTPATRLIAVTNPNNPVGTILTEPEMDAIVAAAAKVGAWILADEVYRGTELQTDKVTPSFWGRYEKTVCVGSLSKAFGLPGLRLGWLVAPPDFVEQAWRRHEYVTIAASTLSMHLAEIALSAETRQRLLARNRRLMREGWARLQRWVDSSGGLLSVIPPAATALGFVRYHLDAPSIEVAHKIRTEGDVLVGAGAHFGVEHHLRITHGMEPKFLEGALQSISRVLASASAAESK
ncbi:PLP-dependent transferase [Coccomyxa subellipsoidea C-169]|uniref:PLP-dependent transferase n=1 Tax=Coccomyxa subellipsoidea (strain C-169) TaxID=574566 RepID=I0Z4Y6_COCSC|nr:PLP-dependent transferase [Coccomyxa subellipsoidea C-169]EIE25705.1 PLP-dependent transferase [Coccomyxa subellipsoidea C-169]|eukprot:XP_005650249.1 PLP-dependent transferase [Coccomyxa subellipsoidea C-169]